MFSSSSELKGIREERKKQIKETKNWFLDGCRQSALNVTGRKVEYFG